MNFYKILIRLIDIILNFLVCIQVILVLFLYINTYMMFSYLYNLSQTKDYYNELFVVKYFIGK
jgi:phosphate starvation-inducible membrane PsiE